MVAVKSDASVGFAPRWTGLPFGSVAQMLTAITRDKGLSKRARVHVLPASWITLFSNRSWDRTSFGHLGHAPANKNPQNSFWPELSNTAHVQLCPTTENVPTQVQYPWVLSKGLKPLPKQQEFPARKSDLQINSTGEEQFLAIEAPIGASKNFPVNPQIRFSVLVAL
jgi:hypothetical protein